VVTRRGTEGDKNSLDLVGMSVWQPGRPPDGYDASLMCVGGEGGSWIAGSDLPRNSSGPCGSKLAKKKLTCEYSPFFLPFAKIYIRIRREKVREKEMIKKTSS
jgi:hypothetical protein